MMTIAMNTFREAFKKKILLLVGILTLIYLILFTLLIYFAVRDINRINEDKFSVFFSVSSLISVIGLYFSSMLVAFFSIMASASAVSSEIESGIIQAVITKPLKRSEYILGKYIGLGILLTVYSSILYVAVIFIPMLIKAPSFIGMDTMSLIKGMLLFILEPLAILSLSLFGSVCFRTISNGIFVIAVYIIGLIGGMMEQVGSLLKNDSLFKWGILSSLISPFDVIYRKMTSVIFSSIGFTNPLFGPNFLFNTLPSRWMMVYVFIFTAAFILFAVMRFNRKDIS